MPIQAKSWRTFPFPSRDQEQAQQQDVRLGRQGRGRGEGGGTQGRKRTTVEEGTCYVGGVQNISKNVRKLQENEINEDGYAI